MGSGQSCATGEGALIQRSRAFGRPPSRGARAWLGLVLVLVPVASARTALAESSALSETILARVIDPATPSGYDDAHRPYYPEFPREFSNGALVETRISLPPIARATVIEGEILDLPDETVISKRFAYRRTDGANEALPCRLGGLVFSEDAAEGDSPTARDCPVELRLLVKRKGVWEAHVFEWVEGRGWNPVPGGRVVELAFGRSPGGVREPIRYSIPSLGACATCHLGRRGDPGFGPIGMTSARLSAESFREIAGSAEHSFLPDETRMRQGRIDEVSRAARKFLATNCGFCHKPNGLARSSGLMLDEAETDRDRLGFCKKSVAVSLPVALGQYDIEPGRPDRSLMLARMRTLDAGLAMPESGRSFVDVRGLAIVSRWIAAMDGSCEVETPPPR